MPVANRKAIAMRLQQVPQYGNKDEQSVQWLCWLLQDRDHPLLAALACYADLHFRFNHDWQDASEYFAVLLKLVQRAHTMKFSTFIPSIPSDTLYTQYLQYGGFCLQECGRHDVLVMGSDSPKLWSKCDVVSPLIGLTPHVVGRFPAVAPLLPQHHYTLCIDYGEWLSQHPAYMKAMQSVLNLGGCFVVQEKYASQLKPFIRELGWVKLRKTPALSRYLPSDSRAAFVAYGVVTDMS